MTSLIFNALEETSPLCRETDMPWPRQGMGFRQHTVHDFATSVVTLLKFRITLCERPNFPGFLRFHYRDMGVSELAADAGCFGSNRRWLLGAFSATRVPVARASSFQMDWASLLQGVASWLLAAESSRLNEARFKVL